MTSLIKTPEYKNWLTELKNRLLTVQLKAAVTVNKQLLEFTGNWEPTLSSDKMKANGEMA